MATIRMLSVFAALAASACASVGPPPDNLPGEVIVYRPTNGPFCGGCIFTTITAADDGRVWIERERRVGGWQAPYLQDSSAEDRWNTSRELITVTPEQLAAFKNRLSPYRPTGQLPLNASRCEDEMEDGPGIDISWRTAGREDRLAYVHGCGPNRPADMENDLLTAPTLLGIVVTLD